MPKSSTSSPHEPHGAGLESLVSESVMVCVKTHKNTMIVIEIPVNFMPENNNTNQATYIIEQRKSIWPPTTITNTTCAVIFTGKKINLNNIFE